MPQFFHSPELAVKRGVKLDSFLFDDGWDKYRERVFARAKAKGWIPQNAQLTPRPASMAPWDSIPDAEKPFQRRLMEVFAGFTAPADYNAGRVIAAGGPFLVGAIASRGADSLHTAMHVLFWIGVIPALGAIASRWIVETRHREFA